MNDPVKISKSLSPIAMLRAFSRTVRANGLRPAIAKAIWYARNLQRTAKLLKTKSIEERFTAIYSENYWGNAESVSGAGSTLDYTANLRKHLPELFDSFLIKTVFDAPCGDFHWMRSVLTEHPVNYVGADIVKPLIEDLNTKYRNDTTSFVHLDITSQRFPAADVWICRDCLFHLSVEDTLKALRNFVDSNISYILTTTHKNKGFFKNKDIGTGDFRFIDLFEKPYYFTTAVLYRVNDYQEPEHPREMCLWSREQVKDALARIEQERAAA
jgi:hypothetical protein